MSHDGRGSHSYTSPNGWFTLIYPHSWEFEESDECTTFYRVSDGVGALQISAYDTDQSRSASDILFNYLADEEIETQVTTDLRPDGYEIATCSYVAGSMNTKIWLITRGNCFAFVTYNYDFLDTQEMAEVNKIVHSLMLSTF